MKISVIMPVYNGEKYLRETIDSILCQTFTDFEFIIINDASKDSTEDIIKSYKDDRIVYLKNEQNLGVAGTLNRGLDTAKGEYIARMDADDIALPERFEKQVGYMDKHENCVICGSNVVFFGAQNGISDVPITDAQIRANLLFDTSFAHPTVMIRHSFVKINNLRYNIKYERIEDYAMWMDFAEVGNGTFYNILEPLLKYRIHPNQVTHKEISPEKKEALKNLRTRAIRMITKENEEKFKTIIGEKKDLNYDGVIKLYEECREVLKHCDDKYCGYIKTSISNIGYGLYNKFSGRQLLDILVKYNDICEFGFKRVIRLCLLIIAKILSGLKTRCVSRFKKKQKLIKLKNKDFTIISNNCWGGLISQKYGLPYRSPTCGLLILGEDYIKFCENLKHYLSQKLEFIEFDDGKYSNLFKDTQFPVAKLDDIEVYFMHYSSAEEASDKWYRRAKRINWDCIIYKISERETFTSEIMKKFAELPLKNKLIFATQKYSEDTVVIPELSTFVGDETPLLADYFDEAKYLNRIKD